MAGCHGEAFSARLAAQHLEGPAQLAGSEYGYVGELCSYARTHLGCAVLSQKRSAGSGNGPGMVGLPEQEELASIRPDLDGNQVMTRLSLRPGRHVGEALSFLLELRLAHSRADRRARLARIGTVKLEYLVRLFA